MRSRETIEALQEADDVFGKADISFLGSLYVAAAMDGETRKHLKVSIQVSAAPAAIRSVRDAHVTLADPADNSRIGRRSKSSLL